jgi:AbrB family looped-hinge helix DNA binding protein
MSTAKISSKGWLVIPAELRKKYRLESGQYVKVVDYGGVLALVPQGADPIAEGMGLLKGKQSLTKALLDSRAQESLAFAY